MLAAAMPMMSDLPAYLDFASLRRTLTKCHLYYLAPNAQWTTAVTGSGTATLYAYNFDLRTTTADGQARAYAILDGLHPGLTIGSRINFDYPLIFAFWVSAEGTHANITRYVQIKNATTHGDLAEQGVGIKISNLSCIGESYGTARGTVNLMTMTQGQAYKVLIAHFPGSRVEFWVDGTLLGTISTTANVPSGSSTTSRSIVTSIDNTGSGVIAKMFTGTHILVQRSTR